jgi:hypothetical protein
MCSLIQIAALNVESQLSELRDTATHRMQWVRVRIIGERSLVQTGTFKVESQLG